MCDEILVCSNFFNEQRIFLNEFGGWPILDSSESTFSRQNFDLEDMLAKMKTLQIQGLVYLYIATDVKNASVNIIQVIIQLSGWGIREPADQPKLYIPRLA